MTLDNRVCPLADLLPRDAIRCPLTGIKRIGGVDARVCPLVAVCTENLIRID